MNPFIIEESQAHYQEHVDAAEAWRLERAARVATPGLADRGRAAIGDRLIAWGMRVKAYAAPAQASH